MNEFMQQTPIPVAETPLATLPWSPAPQSSPSSADVVVIGDGSYVEGVCSALRQISSSVRHVPTLASAVNRGLGRAVAHVLVAPLPETKLAGAILQLRPSGPVFVVVPEDFSDWRARRLYDVGSHVVFEWPSEAQLLPRMIQQRLQLATRRRGPGRDGDEALARSIRARLELASSALPQGSVPQMLVPQVSMPQVLMPVPQVLMPQLSIVVDDGDVSLSGAIDSMWTKHQLEQLVGDVPGVRTVASDALHVLPAGLSDAALVH